MNNLKNCNSCSLDCCFYPNRVDGKFTLEFQQDGKVDGVIDGKFWSRDIQPGDCRNMISLEELSPRDVPKAYRGGKFVQCKGVWDKRDGQRVRVELITFL